MTRLFVCLLLAASVVAAVVILATAGHRSDVGGVAGIMPPVERGQSSAV